jgi:hypothetical protein
MKPSNVATLAIKSDKTVRKFIMAHFGITRQSLWTWIEANDTRLCDPKVITFISMHLEVEKDLLIES